MSSIWPCASCFFPPLGITVLANNNGVVRIYDSQTGRLEKETDLVTYSPNKCTYVSLGYFSSNERLIIIKETEFNARGHSNGFILLHGFLDRRIQLKTEKISLEFDSGQGSVLELFLSCNKGLPTKYQYPIINAHNCQNPKWKTFTVSGSYESLYGFFDNMQHKNVNSGVAAATTLFSSILHRLTRALMDSDSILFFTAMREPFTMQNEAHRRLTFTHWPHVDYQWATPSSLAEAGFYYRSKFPSDIVVCFECLVGVASWEPSDEPWSEHMRHSPRCSFVSSQHSRSIPSISSWSTETAQTQSISDDPIMVLTTTTSKDFVATSTIDGGITIWDVSYYNRRSLEFNLVDVLNAYMAVRNKIIISKSQLQVHSGCLLASDSCTTELISLLSPPPPPPQLPKIHHLILGCCMPYSIFANLYSCVHKTSMQTKIDDVGDLEKFQLCLIIIELIPLNSEQVMWISDSNSSSSTTTTLPLLSFQSISPPSLFNLHSVPFDLIKYLPLIGHGEHTLESETLSGDEGAEDHGADNDHDTIDDDHNDFENDFDEVNSNKLEVVHTNNAVADSVPRDRVSGSSSVSSEIVDNDFYRYIGLSRIVGEFVNYVKIVECQHEYSTNKLQSKMTPSASISSDIFSLTKVLEYKPPCLNETTDPVTCSDHSEYKTANGRGIGSLPKLIDVIPLYNVDNTPAKDIEYCKDCVQQILRLQLHTGFHNGNSTYSQGVLVSCGVSRSLLSHKEMFYETFGDNHQRIENGDLFLFGYDDCCASSSSLEYHSVLSETPLLHIKLPGYYCPVQMDAVSNVNDLHLCSVNSLYPSVRLQFRLGQSNQSVHSSSDNNNNEPKYTLESPSAIATCDLSFCCFILTISNSLLQLNIYKDLSCYAQLIISNPISVVLESNSNSDEVTNDSSTYAQQNIHFDTITYCTGLGNLCLYTVNSEMCIYQLHNQEFFKYDMDKQKRIDLYSSILPIHKRDIDVSSYEPVDEFFPPISSYSLNDLYAYNENPLEQCSILHQLIKTMPVDSTVQVSFPDQIGWYEVELCRSMMSSVTVANNNNNTNCLLESQDDLKSTQHVPTENNKTIQILSKLVTRYLQLEHESSVKKTKLMYDTSNNCLPVTLKCASLAVQLSLSGGISSRLWEFNIKNWLAYQALIKETLEKSTVNSVNTNKNISSVIPDLTRQNMSSEYLLEINLPQVYSISHFMFHSTLRQCSESKSLPTVYITLLRKNASFDGPFVYNPSNSTNIKCNKLSNHVSIIDHGLIVHDLNAPYIDDEHDSTQSTYKTEEQNYFNLDNELLSNYLKIPGRFYQMSAESIISSESLRKLNANIVAGPYLLSDFVDVNGRCSNIPMTSSELIKSRTRLFALNIKIVATKNETSTLNPNCHSATTESQQLPLLSDIFAQIGLSIHQFNNTFYNFPTVFALPSSNQSTTADDEHSSVSKIINTVPHERAQVLAILRSMKLHEDCLHFLSSNDAWNNDSSKWKRLSTISNISSIILDIMNWVVLMYFHELELPYDIIANLLNLAATNCENLLESLIVHGDNRESIQLGTKFMLSLLKLEFIFIKYPSSNNSSYKTPALLHKLCNCLSTDNGSHDYNCSSKLIRWLLTCQTSGGCETLFNLLDFIISYSFHEYHSRADDLNTKSLLLNSLKTLFITVASFGEDFSRLQSSCHSPICLGPPTLLNLPIYKWSCFGSECLQSLALKSQNSQYEKSFTSIPSSSTSNGYSTATTLPVPTSISNTTNNSYSMNLNSENIRNCYSVNKDVVSLNGIFTPKSYVSFITDSKFNHIIDSAQNTKSTTGKLRNHQIPNSQNTDHSLFILPSNDSFVHFADIFTLMRCNFVTNIDNSNNIQNIILPDLQDWPFYGLLDVEPLQFSLDKFSVQLNDDCEIERVDFFTGEPLPTNNSGSYGLKLNESQIKTKKHHLLTSAISHLLNPVEAYHLVISRMHPGAHRSITLDCHPLSVVNLLTDLIIPVNPCLQCITLEAILDELTDDGQSVNKSLKTTTRLITTSIDIGHSVLVLRDIYPPIEFTRLRISMVGRLDCPFTKARIHLGAYFGQNGLLKRFMNPSIDIVNLFNSSDLIQYLESIISSKTMVFISVQQCLIHLLSKYEKSEKISTVSSDNDNEQILSLYKQCHSLQYQLNWLDRLLNRLRNRYSPEKFHEYKKRILEMSDDQMRMNLYPDKVKYIMEHCLLCLLNHINDILSVVQPISLSSSASVILPEDDYTFVNYINKYCSPLLSDMITYGTRSMQILAVGLTPLFTKINSLLPVNNPIKHHFLYKFINEFHAFENFSMAPSTSSGDLSSSLIHVTRRHLLFWAVLQRLIHSGMTSYLLSTSVRILHDVWNRTGNNYEENTFNSELLNNILLLIDAIIENGYSSLLTVHRSFDSFLTALNLRQSSYSGQTGLNGLLKWHYKHQMYNTDRRNAMYPYCQTRTTRINDEIYTYDSLSQYQLCIVSFYRWHLEHLANLSTQYADNREYDYEIIMKDMFPLGALFIRRNIDSQASILMRSCIPDNIQQTNSSSSKYFIPLETYYIPQQRFQCMFGDDSSTIENSLSQLLQILVNVALELLNDLLNTVTTMSRESILFHNCFVVCRLLGRICWHLSGDQIRQYFLPDENISESRLFKFLLNLTRHIEHSSLLNDLIIECLCLILTRECVSDCPQTIKPDNYGDIKSTDLHESQNISWPYPNNSVINYNLQQTTDSLWHLLPSRLLTKARSFLVKSFEGSSCDDHIHQQINKNDKCCHMTSSSENNGHFVLCEIFSNCINILLSDAKSIGHYVNGDDNNFHCIKAEHPYLINVLHLFCAIAGEPDFKPWKLPSNSETIEKCQCYVKTDLQINIELESLQNVLRLLDNFVTNADNQKNISTFGNYVDFLRDFYTLSLHFLAISAESTYLRLYILKSSCFSIFLNTVLTDCSLQAGVNRSCTLALEVLFTWFAYTKLDTLDFIYHPFDKFCLDQLTALFSRTINSSTQSTIIDGPCDLQAVLLTAICSRVKSLSDDQMMNNVAADNFPTHCDSLKHDIEALTLTSCSSHTIANLPADYLLHIVEILLNYMHQRLVYLNQQSLINNNNNDNNNTYFLCFSCYATVVDEEHESYHKYYTLWSTLSSNHIRRKLITSSSANIEQDSDEKSSTTTSLLSNCSSSSIRQFTCCYLNGLCSTSTAYSQILTNTVYNDKCLAYIIGNLCRILTEISNSIDDKQKLQVFFIQNIEFFLSPLRFARVPLPLSTMITLSCLINEWKTLKHFSQLIMNHFRPCSTCDWLFYCVYLLTNFSHSLDSTSSVITESSVTIKTDLLQSLLYPIPLNSCPLLLCLSLCITSNLNLLQYNNNYAKIIFNTFINDIKEVSIASSSLTISSSKRLCAINSSELGQALLQQSLSYNIPYYQQSSTGNFQYLTQSLPIGLFGPISLFKNSSLEYWRNIVNLNYPYKQSVRQADGLPATTTTTTTTCQCVNLFQSNQNVKNIGNSSSSRFHYLDDVNCTSKDYQKLLNDFAPLSMIYSDMLDEQMTSLCNTLSIINGHEEHCKNIIFPLYLGNSAFSSTSRAMSTLNHSSDIDCNKNNPEKIKDSSVSTRISRKFSLTEFLETNFVFHSNEVSLQIIARLPILIQLECIQISVKNSAKLAILSTVEVELYRDLPGAYQRSFISAHKSNKLSLSDCHTISFPPRLVSHVLIRLYRPRNHEKTLRVSNLRLLGRHANDQSFFLETCKNASTNADNLNVDNALYKMRPVVLLHLLQNEILSQSLLPDVFYSHQFIKILLQCLHTVSSNKQLSRYARQLIHMVACHNDIFEVVNSVYNFTGSSFDNPKVKNDHEWLYPPTDHILQVDTNWKSCPSSAVLCERILLGLLLNTGNDSKYSLADYVLAQFLSSDDPLDCGNVSFTSVSNSNQDCTVTNNFNSSYWYGPLAALTSTPNQRLFAWLCLHQDANQSSRIERILNWLSHFSESMLKHGTTFSGCNLNHWSQLILIFSSVLWRLGNVTDKEKMEEGSNSWQKLVTFDLISSIYDLYTSVIKHHQVDLSQNDVDDDFAYEIKQFSKVLISLMCALCAMQPNVISTLLLKLLIIPTTSFYNSQQQDDFMLNNQLKLFTAIFSSYHVVDSMFSTKMNTVAMPMTVSNNFFYSCCKWLSDYFSSSISSSSSSAAAFTLHSALRRLHILTYFMQSNQYCSLRTNLGQLICQHFFSIIFSNSTVISSLMQPTTLNYSGLSGANIYEFSQLQQAIITLYQTVRCNLTVQFTKPLDQDHLSFTGSKFNMTCLTDRLIEIFKESFMKQNFKLSNFLSELLLIPPSSLSTTHIPFKQTIAIYTVTSNHPHTPTDLPWPVVGPPIVLNIDASQLPKSGLVSFLLQKLHQSVENNHLDYSIHPSLSQALLVININLLSPDCIRTNHCFEKTLFVKHLRLIIYHLLHPFSTIHGATLNTNSSCSRVSRPIKLINSTGMNTMNDFELCFIQHTPDIGHTISPVDWDNGIFLPEGYSDNWSIEQLNKFNYEYPPVVISHSRILCLAIRPCEHARFVFRQPSSLFSSKETFIRTIYNSSTPSFQSFTSVFLKSGLLNFIAKSVVRWHIPCLLMDTLEERNSDCEELHIPLLSVKNNTDHWNKSMKYFHDYISRVFKPSDINQGKFFNCKLGVPDGGPRLRILTDEFNSIIPIHSIISYLLLFRLTGYDVNLLNLIESSLSCSSMTSRWLATYQTNLSYLPGYLIQLANTNSYLSLWEKTHDYMNYLSSTSNIYHKRTGDLIRSPSILPFQCLCYLYDNVHAEIQTSSRSLLELRWIHLNSGVLQLILSQMYVLSYGSCRNLPQRFELSETRSYISNLSQSESYDNNEEDSLSLFIQSTNELYTRFIKPACLNLEHELFPSLALSSQDTTSGSYIVCEPKAYQVSQHLPSQINFDLTASSSIPLISPGSASNKVYSNKWAKGTGFATATLTNASSDETSATNENPKTNLEFNMLRSKVEYEDQYAIVLCNALSGFLHTFMHSEVGSDQLFESIVIFFIIKLHLVTFIINYLRNDSIMEIINRSALYKSVFRLIRVISLCPRLHWLLTFIQKDSDDMDDRLNQCFISHSFNNFQWYWQHVNVKVDDSILHSIHNEDYDDDDVCFINTDSSCISMLVKHILSYLLIYKKHLNKLGLVNDESIESENLPKKISAKVTSNSSALLQSHHSSDNTTSNTYSSTLIRRPSMRYRDIYKRYSNNKDLLVTTDNDNNQTVHRKSKSLLNTTGVNYHSLISKTNGSLLQLKSGFYDSYDDNDEDDANNPVSKTELYTLLESTDGTNCDDETAVDSEDHDDDNCSKEKDQQVNDENVHDETQSTTYFDKQLESNDFNQVSSQYSMNPTTSTKNNVMNNQFPNHLENDYPLNDKVITPNNDLSSSDSNVVCVNQEMLTIFYELRTTFKLLQIILKYQQCAVSKSLDNSFHSVKTDTFDSVDYQTTLPEFQSPNYCSGGSGSDNGDSSGYKRKFQSSSVHLNTLSTDYFYCAALKPIQFRTIKFFSVSVNNTVTSLVPHAYADLCAQSDGFVLIGGDTKKPSGRIASSSTSNPQLHPDQFNKLSSMSAATVSKSTTIPQNRSLHRLQHLAQEIVTLNMSLPLSENASVFVCCEENRFCLLKVLITGPPDTPYANGCFEFDIYTPPDYPMQPPLVEFCTTAKNTFRFNPNLYEDGKVCLSILNTWHGSTEERWNPQTSSLLQVLVSIQSLIFVSEPYFNEPGFECSMGTPKGIIVSYKYNARIRVATVRWAMINQLKHLPIGFEEVVLKHFLHRRPFIISQVEQWILEMHNHAQFKIVEVYVKELEDSLPILKTELNRLEERLSDWSKKHDHI